MAWMCRSWFLILHVQLSHDVRFQPSPQNCMGSYFRGGADLRCQVWEQEWARSWEDPCWLVPITGTSNLSPLPNPELRMPGTCNSMIQAKKNDLKHHFWPSGSCRPPPMTVLSMDSPEAVKKNRIPAVHHSEHLASQKTFVAQEASLTKKCVGIISCPLPYSKCTYMHPPRLESYPSAYQSDSHLGKSST